MAVHHFWCWFVFIQSERSLWLTVVVWHGFLAILKICLNHGSTRAGKAELAGAFSTSQWTLHNVIMPFIFPMAWTESSKCRFSAELFEFIKTIPLFLPWSIFGVLIFTEELKIGSLRLEHAFTNVTHLNGPINFRLPVWEKITGEQGPCWGP